MPSEKWRQIEDIFNAALERRPADRPAFLEKACHGDEALRLQVEALLRQDAQDGALLSQPIEKIADEVLSGVPAEVHFPSGSMAGPYRIGERLGAGGMGDVYRAHDTRLQRTVAIKTLKARFTDRFQREARAISALNHPHICTLYDIGSQDGIGYLVMEYVEGQPLKGPLPIPEALRLAIQIAGALEAAHEKGILHRDLKPGNILVSKSGVKLVDFGLAKFMPAAPLPADVTVTAPLTGTGHILGTPAYMSPEQIEGKPAGARSDIFSFGLVLYEMLTGRRAFQSASQNGLMAAILKEEPPLLAALLPSVPAALDRTVSKCLAKDPARRWQTAADLRHELEWIAEGDPAAPRRAFLPWIVAGAATILLVSAGGYFYLHPKPKLTNKDTIVLADFENKTGDPVFDGTLRQGLAVQLEQSPFLSLVSEERIQTMLALMGQPADAPLTPKVARDICERTASAAVLEGSIAPLGSAYVLGLRAANCSTGNILDEEQVQAPRKEDVLNGLSQIASRFRTRVGESLATIEKHATPLPEDTTTSLEALKAYSTGLKISYSMHNATAVPHFLRAIQIDPKFAMAYAFLGRTYGDFGETARSAENITKAYRLRDRTSDSERFFITASYEMQVTGNLENARQTFESWEQSYPRAIDAPGLLSGAIYPTFGMYQKAIEEANKAVALDVDFPFAYINLATAYANLGNLTEASNAVQRGTDRKVEIPEFLLFRYDLAFLKGDKAGMERALAMAKGKPGLEDWIADHEAAALAYSGHLQQARKLAQSAVNQARQAGQQERAALFEIGAALWDAFFGNTAEATAGAKAALGLSQARDVKYGAALALALSGDSSGAQTLANQLAERFPEDTSVRFSYLPVLSALIAKNRGEPAHAVELLEPASRYELGTPASSFNGNFGSLYPVYVRGEAYLAAHQYAQAAAEFQKVVTNRNIPVSDPVGALAHWRLGKAWVLSGDTAKAKIAYNDFLALWKDADPGIPILIQAKAEYAELR